MNLKISFRQFATFAIAIYKAGSFSFLQTQAGIKAYPTLTYLSLGIKDLIVKQSAKKF